MISARSGPTRANSRRFIHRDDAMPLVTQTENFIYETAPFDPLHPDLADFGAAWARANALAATCECDLATLQKWFGVSGGFGPANKVTVRLDASISAFALGRYASDGSSTIIIVPFTQAANADEAARAVFVHEMFEILMDYRNPAPHQVWIAGNSMGEALATVCEALIHPEGHYGAQLGPCVWEWLSLLPRSVYPFFPRLSRENWIDKTDDSDRNFVSFRCGIVFLYYLLWRGYPIEEIIAKGDSTFERRITTSPANPGAGVR
jgi:hypothetical protein